MPDTTRSVDVRFLWDQDKMPMLFTKLQAAGRLSLICAVAAAGVGATSSSVAAYSKRVESACRADYKNLCPQYRPNTSALRACMESKSSEISWGCKQALIDSGEVDRKYVRR